MTVTPPFEYLLAAHRVRANRVALGFMGKKEDAQDAAQEAMLKAYRARDRYDVSRPFYPWFYRIIKNTCLDAIARRKRRPLLGLDTERAASRAPPPGAALDLASDIARMRVALTQLSEEHREILVLRHFDDQTYAEIAHILGLARGTVMSRLYRARRALARAMEDV